jgi:hypothetical protein
VEKGMHSVIQLVLKNEGMLASINISQNKWEVPQINVI